MARTKKEGVKIGRLGASVGLVELFPAMCPFPLHDTQGMGIVLCMLQRSLDKVGIGTLFSLRRFES